MYSCRGGGGGGGGGAVTARVRLRICWLTWPLCWLGRRRDWWRIYDSCFRQQLPALELAEFGRLDQALFTRTIFSSGGAGISQRGGPTSQPESRNPPAAKRCRVASRFAWNDRKSCVATPCRYFHICSRCGGEYRKTSCPPPPTDNPSVPANSSV